MLAPDGPGWPCLRAAGAGCVLEMLVAPNAKRTACMGLHGEALRVRLAAVPADGAANEALLRWLAGELGVARHAVALVRGASSKRKGVQLDVPAAQVAAWLARVVPAAG